MKNYVVGLDIGITSVGFSIIDLDNADLVEMGVRHFEAAEEAKTNRLNRGARRLIDRKRWRKRQLINAFIDFGLINKNDIIHLDANNKETIYENYLRFHYYDESISKPIDHTIYHLRKRALYEEVSNRELLLALYNICKTRGHFLLENIDFENNATINFSTFKEKYYELTSQVIFYVDNHDNFDETVLNDIFTRNLTKANDIKAAIKLEQDDETNSKAIELLKIICGFKGDLSKVTDDESLIGDKKNINVSTIKSMDANQVTDFMNGLVELYDLIQIHSIIDKYDYLCEVAVDKLDKYIELNRKNRDSEEYKEFKTLIQGKMSPSLFNDKKKKEKNENSLRVVKNLDNSYPNGLYVKEAKAILHKQQEFNANITDEFIEVVASILSARIPFFVGPLAIDAKNAWIENKKCNFKYSYEYSMKNLNPIDVKETIKEWKKRMISHCTYLVDQPALPKGSFIYETFSILNEINILKAEDKNHETYYLTREDKVKIFNELFLKETDVTYKNVEELLNLSYFGDRAKKAKKFNNKYTLYHSIARIVPELKIADINEIFTNKEKIDKLESIILDISLFDEEKARINNFKEEFNDKAEALGKLKVSGFYSLSKEFLTEEVLNTQGESMLDILFDDNPKDKINEQMTIITKATDINGNPKNFSANKYLKILEKNNQLSIDLLVDGTKPIMPISRPVIRGLNECFKVYQEILKVYGTPKRLVIETARDFGEKGKVTKKHADTMKEIYDTKARKVMEKESQFRNSLENWEEIDALLTDTNKRKIELYITQCGVDMIDGHKIDLHRLYDYEIDHILPRGFGEDAIYDKMLIHKMHNREKGDRVPLQYIAESNNIGYKQYIDRVEKLYDYGLISDKKKDRLLLKNTEEVSGFIEQNLVDTRYIIKEFTSIISAYNKLNDYDTHIVSLKSAFTKLARRAFGMNKKDRDFGLQHHAHDACMIALADTCLNTIFPNYDQRGNFKKFDEFLKNMPKQDETIKDKEDPNVKIMRFAYQNAFNQPYKYLINKIKETVPLYSEKVIHKGSGQYFDATLYSPEKGSGPLSVLGVNDDKKSFTSVNCAAVDFYRYVEFDKKTGKHIPKNVAIHIPKVIIDQQGNIDKEQYIKLIKEYYKANELLDDSGEIVEGYFRFRAFRNDIIYDTWTNYPQLFNIGSIAKKLPEFKHFDMDSYNSIYRQSDIIFNETIKHFGWKNNDGSINWKEWNKLNGETHQAAKKYIYEYIGIIERKHIEDINDMTKDIKRLDDFCNTVSHYYLWTIKPNKSTSIKIQYTPPINKTEMKGKEDIEYIKLKTSPLGFRFEKDADGKLIISGPKGNSKAYSKIRKEKFSWKISKYSV